MATFYKTAETLLKGVKTLSRLYYTDNDIFKKELDLFFEKGWICSARSSDLKVPGQFFTKTIGNESIIILRDNQNDLKAFYNLCRHRGTQICTKKSGHLSKSIQCRYHGWTYNLSGELIGAPHMEAVEGFKKNNYPLHKINVIEWQGFIFINLNNSSPKLGIEFNILQKRISNWDIDKLITYKNISYSVNCNWKLILQNYSECYHCPLIHPELAEKTPYTSGKNDMTSGAILGGYMDLNSETITNSGQLCGPILPNIKKDDQSRVYYYSIFPNMTISLHPDYVMFHQIFPITINKSIIDCYWLFQDSDKINYDPMTAVNFWNKTNKQDWNICEQSQRGIQSKKYSPGPYSGQESLLAAFDKYYLDKIKQ